MSQATLAKIVADFETSLATAMAVGATSVTIQSATDDDGVALPTGRYFFTIDGNNSSKEHISCTLTSTSLTDIKTLSRQGIETSGCLRAHRVGAKVILTDFAHIKKLNDLLDGTTLLDPSVVLAYSSTASITGTHQLATKDYVDSGILQGAADASTTVKGIAFMSTGPLSATGPIAVGTNDPRLPTQAENDALAGTSGTPSSTNKFVTNDDTSSAGATGRVVRATATGLPAMDGSNLLNIGLSSELFIAGETVTAGQPAVRGSGKQYKLTAVGGTDSESNTSDTSWVSQSFTTSARAISIKSVSLLFKNSSAGTITPTITVSIRANSGGDPTGTNIESKTSVISTSIGNSAYKTGRFIFSSPVSVSPSTTYHVIIKGSEGNLRTIRGNTAGQGTNTSTDSGGSWSDANGAVNMVIGEIDTVEGRMYVADANILSRLEYVGFFTTNSTAGNTVGIKTAGIITGLSGLTTGLQYFVSDTAGTLSTTVGTYEIPVGTAVSTTELLIERLANTFVGSEGVTTYSTTIAEGMTIAPPSARYAIVRCVYGANNSAATFVIYRVGSTSGQARDNDDITTLHSVDATWSSSDIIELSFGDTTNTATIYYYR